MQLKITTTLFLIALTVNSRIVIAQENLPETSVFFKLVVGEGNKYFYTEPDSMLNDPEFSGFASNLYAFNDYLYQNYTVEMKKREYLDSLLCDTAKLFIEHQRLINTDRKFQELFHAVYFRHPVPPISIDSIQNIVAHFFYLHRLKRGLIVTHMCVQINEVLQMKQNDYSPYYNAFSFMVIRNQDPFLKVKPEITTTMPLETEDKALEEEKNKNYEKLRSNKALRQMIIDEYELKKKYLNFKIIY